MLSTFSVILPVFLLILCGWLLRKGGWVGASACAELNKFVVLLALPALLFDIVAKANWQSLWQPDFIGCFILATFAIFIFCILLQWRQPGSLADKALDGLNSSYANTGFMGFPLLLTLAGQHTQTQVLIATLITVSVLFAVGIVLIEIGVQAHARKQAMFAMLIKKLATNPLLVAPCLGLIFPLLQLPMPAALDSALSLLGGAAAPCALVTIGLFLGGRAKSPEGLSGHSLLLVAAKLLLHPLLALLLAHYVFALAPLATFAVVVLAALPTGTGPFMLAEYYQRDAKRTSDVILVSTLLSPISLALLLMWLTPLVPAS